MEDVNKMKKTTAASLEGLYCEEHLFTLKQSVQLYNFYQELISACEKAIENQLQMLDGKINK
jgi:transposase